MFGGEPVTDTAAPVGRFYRVASDGPHQRAIQPDAEIGSESVFELRRRARKE